jgi:hypothetical protein
LVFFTPDNVLSRAMSYLKANWLYWHRWRVYGKKWSDGELRAKLRKGGEEYPCVITAKRHVKMFKAERSGDHKTFARLQAYEERGYCRSVQQAKRAIAGISKGRQMKERAMKTTILTALIFASTSTAQADNSSLGQNKWCWQPASGTVMFCDYTTYSSCVSANRGKEDGTCVRGQ